MHDTGIRRVAFLATDGVDGEQLVGAWQLVERAGVLPILVGTRAGELQCVGRPLADPFTVDLLVEDADAMDADAAIICDGAFSIAGLGCDPETARLLRAFARAGVPVATVGGAALLLAEAGVVERRTVAAPAHVADALAEAGARLSTGATCVDDHLFTARGAAELPALVTHLLGRVRQSVPAFSV